MQAMCIRAMFPGCMTRTAVCGTDSRLLMWLQAIQTRLGTTSKRSVVSTPLSQCPIRGRQSLVVRIKVDWSRRDPLDQTQGRPLKASSCF